MRTHNPEYARSEYHTQLAKMSFDKIFDLTAGVYFHFYNILYVVLYVVLSFILYVCACLTVPRLTSSGSK